MCRAQASPLLQVTETFVLQEVLELAFSILYDPDETLNFIAPNKYEVSRGTALDSRALPVTLQLEGRSGQNRNVPVKAGGHSHSRGSVTWGSFPLSQALQVTPQQ